MQVAAPIKGQPAAPRVQVPRYKALAKLERESQQKLEDLVTLYDRRLEMISEDVRAEAMQLLRSPAQRAILNALEVRTPEIDEDFGYEWADALAEMNAEPARASATDLFMARMPELDALLKDPAVRQRNEVEWLYRSNRRPVRQIHTLPGIGGAGAPKMEGTVSGSLRNRRVHCAPAGPEDAG